MNKAEFLKALGGKLSRLPAQDVVQSLVLAALVALRAMIPTGLLLWGGALVCAGLTIPLFLGSNLATKGLARCSRGVGRWLKGLFLQKEAAV